MTGRENLNPDQILALVDILQTGDGRERRRRAERPLPRDLTEVEGRDLQSAYDMMSFMENMPGGFLIYRAGEGEEIIYANSGLMRIFRCDSIEEFRRLTGNSFRGMVYPDDLEGVEQSIAEQIAASQLDLDYVEYRIVRKDGTLGWIQDYGHFVRSKALGDIFYVFLVDATEKQECRQMEQVLRPEEDHQGGQKRQNLIDQYNKERSQVHQEYLRRLEVIEGLSVNYESIFYADLETNIILPYRLSARTEPVFMGKSGMEYSDFMHAYVGHCVHEEDQERVMAEMSPIFVRRQLAGEQSFYLNFRAVEGEAVGFLQAQFVNVGRKDRVSRVVIGCRRVDDEFQHELRQKKLLEEALRTANSSIVAKNTFLSNMSHDMRTPLNAIFGYTALARSKLEDPQSVAGYLDKIEHSSKLLLELIDKVLKLSWMDSNEYMAEEGPCSLEEVLRESFDFLYPQAEEKGLRFTMDCSRVRCDAIYSDKEKLSQLVMYLLNNALTYTNPGGSVTLTAIEEEALSAECAVYRISVKDTGIGISEEFLQQIFEPFTRERNTTLSGIHGAGLGLTIAKNIAELLGGSIEVDSAVDRGSTFTVILRLRQQKKEGAENAGAQEDGLGEQGYSILLVEDNEINREIEQAILTNMGFTVDTAVDGSIAVDMLKANGPGAYDLVLMDIQMPVMNGWEAAEAIRALPDKALARIPILALSANVFESDIQRSRDAGMDAHLAKPIDVPLLLRTIKEALRKSRE